MRELDLNQVYFDRMGNPLVGRVQFFERGTTKALQVYDSNGVSLGSVLFTNSGKLNPQVFLADADYSIVWERYRGNGTMASDDDPLHWLPAGSADSLQPVFNVSVENDGVICVDTITALRALDPSMLGEHLVVTLLGYNSVGDKPSVNYVYDENCEEDDNGGSVIKHSGSDGAYVIVIGEEVDARHFGVFPKATINETDSTDSMRLQLLNNWCVDNGKYAYLMDNGGGVGYYRLGAGTYTRLVCQNSNARLVLPTGTSATLRQYNGRDIFVYSDTNFTGSITLSGPNLHSSYDVAEGSNISWTIFDTFTIDTIEQTHIPSTFTKCKVNFLVDSTKGYTFIACDIPYKRLDTDYAYSFQDMRYTDLFFTDTDESISVSLENCTIDIDDFANVANWVYAKNYQGDDEFDFRGKAYDGAFLLGRSQSYRIYNAEFKSTFTIPSSTTGVTLRFYNCVFDEIVNNASNLAFQFYDCQIKDDVVFNGGSVILDNCIIDGDFGGETLAEVNCKGTKFAGVVECVHLHALSCDFENVVTIHPSVNIFECDINSCKIEKNFVLDSEVGTTNTINCRWTNNVFNSIASILLQGGSAATSLNNYKYENNTYLKNNRWVDGSFDITSNQIIALFPQIVMFGFNTHKLKCSYVLIYRTDLSTSHLFTDERIAYYEDIAMNGNTNTPTFGRSTGIMDDENHRPVSVLCHIELV